MGPEHRERSGIWCWPKKPRRRRRAFHIPLLTADALELDRWVETPILFANSRWKAPILRHRDDLYLYSPRAVPYTETSRTSGTDGAQTDAQKPAQRLALLWQIFRGTGFPN